MLLIIFDRMQTVRLPMGLLYLYTIDVADGPPHLVSHSLEIW